MQNVKKVNSINDILEEIVKCVTAPSFCVMPWKCVTMAVGDRSDPSVKKSVVHIYRTCVNGQNIFQIKVHNCKKEVCDHAICTTDCENTRETNPQPGKETIQNEINKRKRKKRNKNVDFHKQTVGCYKASTEEYGKKSIMKERQDTKHRNTSVRLIKKSEDIEKPSCTLQIFAEGRSRKLNFQLHPAMKVFLGKALDRIEGHGSKGRGTTSQITTNRMPDRFEASMEEIDDDSKSKMKKTLKSSLKSSQHNSKNLRTESVEEFEINLPDNTCNAKDYTDNLSQISGRSCHCDENLFSGNVKDESTFLSGNKIDVGYLLNIIPSQKSGDGKRKSDKEAQGVRTESPLGRTPEKCNKEQLMTDNTHQKTTGKSFAEPHHERERGMLNHNEERLMRDNERFHSPDLRNLTFQDEQTNHCTSTYDNYEAKSKIKQNPVDAPRNISCETENNQHSYSNSSQCFKNNIKDNLIRTPYVVDYHSDNKELLVNDFRNINNRNYNYSDRRAPMHSTDINYPSLYRSNTKMYPLPFSMIPEYGTFLANDGVYSNRFYGSRTYHNFSDHGMDFINMRVAPTQEYETYDRRLLKFPKEHRKPHIFNDEGDKRKDSRIFHDPYRLWNTRDIDAYAEPEKRMFFRKNNGPRQYLEDVPTSDRSHNITKDPISNINYREELIDYDLKEKCRFDRQRYKRLKDGEKAPKIRTNHPSSKSIKRKDCKVSKKSNSNSDNTKPENSTEVQSYNMQNYSTTIDSNTSSNKQNPSDYNSQTENRRYNRAKKNRKEKSSNKMIQCADHTSYPTYKLLNKHTMICENERHFFEREKNFKKFKHIKPSKISSEENVNNSLKRNNQKLNSENSNILKTNAVYHRKTSKESDRDIKRTQSTDSTNSSNYFGQDVYINDASEKSSGTSSFGYDFPEKYTNYQFFKPLGPLRNRKQVSLEIVNDTNETLCDDEYDSDSKFFCFPSQISWDHENPNQIIPETNQEQYLKVKDKRGEQIVEPTIQAEGGSSKLCHACCKMLNEEKPGIRSSSNSNSNKYETKNSCTNHIVMNSARYKNGSNLGEPFTSNNDFVRNKGMDSCKLKKKSNLNEVGKPKDCPKSVNDSNHVVKRNDLIEKNETTKSESLQKKQSKILHSQSVKKFFSHAKEYLNFRKYSTSSIRSGLSNGALNNCNHFIGSIKNVENNPCLNSKYSVEASDLKKNNDCCNMNKKQGSIPETCLENDTDILKLTDNQARLSNTPKQTEALKNNIALTPYNYHETKISKPATYSLSQSNLKDEKYRLYGSNIPTIEHLSKENTNQKCIKNEFEILETESECECYSDDMYCYSSSEWQSEVAKNWVATTKKKHSKHYKRVAISLKKNKSKSFHSLKSDFSNCKIEKEEKFVTNNNKPMINVTIALSPDQQKRKENKVGIQDQFQENPYQKQKNNKFSNLFSSSIKNNYKKIKGLVRINHTYQKKKSPTRMHTLKLPSNTETGSLSCLTPVTSTYIPTKSQYSTFVEKSTIERFCNESTTNNYTSDFVKSEPIIKKIEPGTWQRIVSKKTAMKSTETSGTENIATENSSISEVSIDESGFQVRSNHKLIKPFGKTRDIKRSTKPSKNYFSDDGPPVEKRRPTFFQVNRKVPSESMDGSIQSDESLLNVSNNCFENPMVDPKTGFRPLLPT